MDDYASLAAFGPYQEGDSFEREFDRVVARWRGRIELHAGDLHEQVWDAGAIEVLLVDAMKSWSLAHRIVTEFYPALVPGAAFVIYQDFSNADTPWIHLSTYRLRGQVIPVADISDSETRIRRRPGPGTEDARRVRAGGRDRSVPCPRPPQRARTRAGAHLKRMTRVRRAGLPAYDAACS